MKRKNPKRAALLALTAMIAASWALPAAAQQDIDVSRELNADGKLWVENISGSVIVSGWDRSEVRIEGKLGEGSDRLDVDGNEKRLKVKVILPHKARNVRGSHLEIRMPMDAVLYVSTVSADIEVTDLRGEIHLQSVSGNIGAQTAATEFEAESVSGDLELFLDCEDIQVDTVSGDVGLESKKIATLEINTVSGDAEIFVERVERFGFNSVSGDLGYMGRIEERGRLNSQSGDLELIFPGGADAEFEISTFSGDIECSFGPKPKKSNRFNISKSLEFTAGGGKASIDIESFSGDITLQEK